MAKKIFPWLAVCLLTMLVIAPGTGVTPLINVLFQSDVNVGGHNLTNAAGVQSQSFTLGTNTITGWPSNTSGTVTNAAADAAGVISSWTGADSGLLTPTFSAAIQALNENSGASLIGIPFTGLSGQSTISQLPSAYGTATTNAYTALSTVVSNGLVTWGNATFATISQLINQGAAITNALANQGVADSNYFASIIQVNLNGTTATNTFSTIANLNLYTLACSNLANQVGTATTNGYTALSTVVSNGLVAWDNATFATLTGLANQGTAITNWANGAFQPLSAALTTLAGNSGANLTGIPFTGLSGQATIAQLPAAYGTAGTNYVNAVGLLASNMFQNGSATLSNIVGNWTVSAGGNLTMPVNSTLSDSNTTSTNITLNGGTLALGTGNITGMTIADLPATYGTASSNAFVSADTVVSNGVVAWGNATFETITAANLIGTTITNLLASSYQPLATFLTTLSGNATANSVWGANSGSTGWQTAPAVSGANLTANTTPLSTFSQGTTGQILVANTGSASTYSSTPTISGNLTLQGNLQTSPGTNITQAMMGIIYSNALHQTGVPTLNLDLGANSAVTIPSASIGFYRPGACDAWHYVSITNGTGTGTNSGGAFNVYFTNTFSTPYLNPPVVTLTYTAISTAGGTENYVRLNPIYLTATASTTGYVVSQNGNVSVSTMVSGHYGVIGVTVTGL